MRQEVLTGEDFDFSLAPEETAQLMIPGTEFAYAPVVEGADAGFAWVLIQGKAVGRIPVVYGQTVEQEVTEEKNFFQRLFGE